MQRQLRPAKRYLPPCRSLPMKVQTAADYIGQHLKYRICEDKYWRINMMKSTTYLMSFIQPSSLWWNFINCSNLYVEITQCNLSKELSHNIFSLANKFRCWEGEALSLAVPLIFSNTCHGFPWKRRGGGLCTYMHTFFGL